MGLAEKREIKEFQDNYYEKLKKDIDTAAGFPVNIEVRWDSLAKDGYEDLLIEATRKIYFTTLKNVFLEICQDDLGREAAQESLKKIVIDGSHGSSAGSCKFESGTLYFNHENCTNMDYTHELVKGLVQLISSKL